MGICRFPLVITVLLCVASTARAEIATEVVTLNRSGREHRALITANKVRMDLAADSYMLADLVKDGKFYRVDPTRKRIVDLSSTLSLQSKNKPVNQTVTTGVKLVESGEGPEIIGYATKRYFLVADDRVCGEFFVSSKVLEIENLRRFTEVTRDIRSLNARRGTPLWTLARNPCSRARIELGEEVSRLGLPLRTFDENGIINQEVISIKTGVEVTAEKMSLPEGYQMTTASDAVRKNVGFARTGTSDPGPMKNQITGTPGQLEEELLRKRIIELEKLVEELQKRLGESGQH
jgi:hypothetical protein